MFWHCTEEFTEEVKKAIIEANQLDQEEEEESKKEIKEINYDFIISKRNQALIKDQLISLEEHNIEEKIVISYCLAQNYYIEDIQKELNGYLEDFIKLSNNLVQKGYTNLSKKKCYMIIGEIFCIANKITFSKGVLDAPNYDFSDDVFQKYETARSYYNISARTEDVISVTSLIIDFYHIMIAELNEKGSIIRDKICLFLVIGYSIIHFLCNAIFN